MFSPPLELPTDRPLLLLDIDGVINAFQRPDAVPTRLSKILPPFKLLPGILDWLAQLDSAFYLVWCSTLGHLVNLGPAEALGLQPRPIIQAKPHEIRATAWKVLAVGRLLAGWVGPAAWVEDGFWPEDRAWAAARHSAGAPTWLVDVMETALTAAVTRELLEWALQADLGS